MSRNIPKSAIGMKSGSKNESVKSVQAYLQEFGYLQSESQPFAADDVYMRDPAGDHVLAAPLVAKSGVFNNDTVTALKDFQGFTGLPQTGELDKATLKMMNAARCGNPDESSMSEFVTGVGKWSSNNLTYSFQNYTSDISNVDSLGDRPSIRDVVRRNSPALPQSGRRHIRRHHHQVRDWKPWRRVIV